MYCETHDLVISSSSLQGPRNTLLPQTTALLINCSACMCREASVGFYGLHRLPTICSYCKNHAAAAWKWAEEQFGADLRANISEKDATCWGNAGGIALLRPRSKHEAGDAHVRCSADASLAHLQRVGRVSPICPYREELQQHQRTAQPPCFSAPWSLQTPRSSLPWPPLITLQSGLNCRCKRFIKVCVAC